MVQTCASIVLKFFLCVLKARALLEKHADPSKSVDYNSKRNILHHAVVVSAKNPKLTTEIINVIATMDPQKLAFEKDEVKERFRAADRGFGLV